MANITHPIPDTRPTEPYFRISEANSVIFAMVQEYNNTSIYQNVFNEKSCQANTQIADSWTHEYQSNDVVTTQFWSNYEDIEVVQNYLDETNEISESFLRVENIGNQDSRDAKLLDLDGSKTGVYFESGNLYEFDSEVVIGTYELNGLVPSEFGVEGNYIYLTAIGWFQIESVIYDKITNANVLVIDLAYPALTDIIIASQYNTKPYNVYEFDLHLLDLENKEDKIMNVSLSNTDSRILWSELKYSSENIKLIDYDNQMKELIWFNYYNSADLYFSDNNFYGVTRLPFIHYKEGADTKTQTEITGNTSFTTSSRNIHKKILSLDYVTAQMFRKLTEISTHEEIFIDRIQYTVDKVDFEEIGNTNTYRFEIELNAAETFYNPLADRLYCGNRRIGVVYSFDSLEWDFSSTEVTFDSN